MLSPAIHNAAENNLNELYIVAKTKVLLPVWDYYFELGDKHCMRLSLYLVTISKILF
jgi:putative colanic acid biosynthesis UDP-glucose lipid carrier transferase